MRFTHTQPKRDVLQQAHRADPTERGIRDPGREKTGQSTRKEMAGHDHYHKVTIKKTLTPIESK